ncbi:MAG: SDR family oxidoreductase [Acetobacteraceae bacterium]|nr:SDR family oxidoreductase [Acetobacteraceae bacterium]
MTALRIPDLDGKVFLVTGGSGGIGAAVARGLAAQGALVAVHCHLGEDSAHHVAEAIRDCGGKAFVVRGDLSGPEEASAVVERTARHYGRLEGLINNAGNLIERRAISDSDLAHDRAILEVNALSVVWTTRAALPWLSRTGGVVINTTSVVARNGGAEGAILYAAAKGFVSTFTRGFAKEVIKHGIRVNAVAPGVILTPWHERFSTEEQIKTMIAAIPMGRAGTPDDCVGAYLFLASDLLSGYITGQILEVNGGQLMP